jgi:ABC-type uncharacterized transport system involved in gliding motility auxiliary subunit
MMNRIFSFIGWVGTALVLAAVGVRYFLPARDQYATYLAWAGLVCMALYIASQWREIAGYFRTRQARYGTLAAFSIFIALGILVAVNYIGKRENKRWDLTASKQFSLSDQSRNYVSKLDAPLTVRVFDKDINFQQYRDRLQEYEYNSKLVKAEYTDPDRNPAAAQQYKVEQYGTLIFEYKGRSERITQDTEQDITNAIIKVVSGQQKKVYFTDGHGEKDTTSSERDGYNTIVQALGRENYTTEKIVLAQKGSVPDDATAVALRCSRRRRRERTHGAAAREYERQELGRDRCPGTAERPEDCARSGQGQSRADYPRVGGDWRGAARSGQTAGHVKRPEAGSASRGVRRF